ncbi:MAG: xanthine dehydrogenase family protein molybdopterin-binding subunit [Aurantimonas endophytica]|uniref:Xanthine dehydrogenase YagR molybdenum-binding subunit n=1 Tax=Aurantimonas endophytica TaxID=1522175 RepID=A0A7W6HER0_9HYPH|nr:xanthine dehydrogenase family protein molybdopterin-binding subunit [Aurantimonas endophytica]MBB4003657.1 xanthine dehydrogenase YagR molybdenum-binding subunit [Aurantimonas endophytica]MCO6404514.1 molybdopterin-dependent oxidoreductase [Aurantimonas endophytica]
MPTGPFPDRERVDAREKVTGTIRYAADLPFSNLLHAMIVPATVAKGRMTSLSTEAALRIKGVVRVLTPDDFPPPPPAATSVLGSDGGELAAPPPTLERQIAHRGQPVALVLAETLEAAIEGAESVRATFTLEDFSPLIESDGGIQEAVADLAVGDARQAMTRAVTTVEAEYESPPQHHNPIELISTTAVWDGGRLTIHEGTQHSRGIKDVVAQALQLDPQLIDVKSPSIGGAFGQKNGLQRQTALVAHAAMLIGRPVKLVMPRGQIFHVATFRPHSRHRIKLGADAAGKMIAVNYDAEHQQSRTGGFAPFYHTAPVQLYGISDYLGTAAHIRIDTQSPGSMRCPHPQAGCFAFESAVDELAIGLDRDPVAFRLAHDTRIDIVTGRPLSSRFLHECIREGASRFGWARRDPRPASTTLSDGTQIGWGMACGSYPVLSSPTIATLRIGADGSTRFAVGGHEMGQGIRTAIASILLEGLAIDPEQLEILIGDTTVAPQHTTAGSWGTTSVAPVTAKVVARMRAAMSELLDGRQIEGNLHRQLATIRRPSLTIEVSHVPPGRDGTALDALRRTGDIISGPVYPEFSTYAYVAHFVEVHVEPRTRRVRVPRTVSIVDCGRVISPRTAISQVQGAVVWAFGGALREATEVDGRYGGWLNNDFADYVVPVNADIGEIEVGFIDQPDPLLNSVGAKGVAEIAMAGASPAIANAIFHATGKRLRRMPIRTEDLL